MYKTPRIQLILVILISLLVGYYFGVNKINFDWGNYRPKITVESKEPPAHISNVDFSAFWTVWQKLEGTYYDKTKLDPQIRYDVYKLIDDEKSVRSETMAWLKELFSKAVPKVWEDDIAKFLKKKLDELG